MASSSSSYAEESIPSSPYSRFFANISSYASRLLFGEQNSVDENGIEEESGDLVKGTPESWGEEGATDNLFVVDSEDAEDDERSLKLTREKGHEWKGTSNQVLKPEKTFVATECQAVRPDMALERLKYLERKVEQLEASYIATERRLQQLEKNIDLFPNHSRLHLKPSFREGLWSDKILKGMSVWRPFSTKRNSATRGSSGSFRSRLLDDMKRVRHHIPLLHWSSDEAQDSSSSENSSDMLRSSSNLSSSFAEGENVSDSSHRDQEGSSPDKFVSKNETSSARELQARDSFSFQSFSTAREKSLPLVDSMKSKESKGTSPRKIPADKQFEKKKAFQAVSDDPAYYDLNSFQYGNYLLWSGKLTDAAKFFQKRIENKCDSSYRGWPGLAHPRDLLLYAESYMLRVWFTGSIQQASEASELFERAIEAAWNGQRVLERVLDKEVVANERERQLASYDWEDCRLVIADGNLFKSIMLALAGHTLKAGITLRKGWKAYASELDNVIQEFEQFRTCYVYTERWEEMRGEEEFSCIAPLRAIEKELCLGKVPVREYIGLTEAWMFGLGFYLLLVSLAPPGYYKVLQVLGFQANRPLGLALLEAAFSRALIKDSPTVEGISCKVPLPLSSPVAAHAIAWDLLEFYAFSASEYELPEEKRLPRANMVCRRCIELFPDSPIWLWLTGVYQRKLGNLDNCVTQLKESVAQFEKNEKTSSPVRLLEYVRYMYLLQGDFEQIERISRQLLQQCNDSIPIGSYLFLGIVELSRGNLAAADSMFQKANTFVAGRSLTDFEEFCQWKAAVLMQRQFARVVSAEIICCSLMYQSLKKDHIQPWIDWLVKDKKCLEEQLEKHLQNKKKNAFSEDASPKVTNLFSSWKKLSRTNISTAVRGDERSIVSELSVCYYALGTFYRLVGDLVTAEDYLTKVCENMNEEDSWLAMCSRFEIALVYWEGRKVSMASDYLRRSLAASRNVACGNRAFVSQIQRCKRMMKV
ncbi:hypothetical protein Gasu2_53140 [Galdieria sulphuraria]|uniref:Uncharacterized protein n=1 Tax=Galdieria sulphuraria TaxID=130081 RepID=M2XYS3_GALSU|nr:uncharacterized protein Gasu_37090 [Galdieria sulphuraria]EME28818.1 hypothetical protein Gasu_37090 [Galdieria sulphuraria]GJD11171.1 hypothetical protein Gasu2_53140 [Galdieria sulphuraria]|eukprot:XP_005705338.1 hypothetical protein Gasu_37090 [Galdieria sulphuraria]